MPKRPGSPGCRLIFDRHPLQELTVPSYVVNDTFIVGGQGTSNHITEAGNAERTTAGSSPASYAAQDRPSMLVMTGPNYSGKSVHLKHVALTVYMAHIGCFVPADVATIGLTDKILTRIATKETITRAQSAFMTDLQQVNKALNLATHRSLVIVDEFGRGTDSNGKPRWSPPKISDLIRIARWRWSGLRCLRTFPEPWCQ